MNLIQELNELRNSEIKNKVQKRLQEFKDYKNKPEEQWFSELCFCILTSNSKARTAIQIQNELKENGFINKSEKEIRDVIFKNKHRFHNNKAKYIVEARKFKNIKEIITGKNVLDAREFLVNNIKGLGFKEASHFLRNVGYDNIAILDRHIINLMIENNYLKDKPKSLNKKNYLEIEKKYLDFSKQVKIDAAELDLYMWYIKGRDVLK